MEDIKENESYFTKNNIYFTTVSSDSLENFKAWQKENQFPLPMLADEEYKILEDYGVYYHDDERSPNEDEGKHVEPAVFLLDEKGRILFMQKQSGPFGRPDAKALRKTTKYIEQHLK
nr:redoxin domain-containing protein [Alkalicoccus saliphilus]